MPFVKPVTIIGLAVPVALTFPGLEVTVYPVIALPPSELGAVKDTVACEFPAIAFPIVGALRGLIWQFTWATTSQLKREFVVMPPPVQAHPFDPEATDTAGAKVHLFAGFVVHQPEIIVSPALQDAIQVGEAAVFV